MITTIERYHSIVILVIFTSFCAILSFMNDDGMTEWGEMKGYFLTKTKPLISKFISFLHHSVIPSQYLIHGMIIPFICWSFLLLEVIPVSFKFQTESLFSGWSGMTGMTSEWFNMLLSLYKRQHHIKSFRGHSCHLSIIPHHEWPLNGLICCCLFIRDSTILNHSEHIPVI